jgi:hypothetical protein
MASEAVAGKPLRELVAEMVKEFAPEEQPLIDALQEFDDETALQRLTASAQRDGRLGFGLETATALMSPIVWIAVDQAVRRIVDSASDHAGKSNRLRRLLPGRRRGPAVVTVPPLTTEQLVTVKQSVTQAALRAGLDPERSENIANGVVRRLVLAPAEGTSAAAEPA